MCESRARVLEVWVWDTLHVADGVRFCLAVAREAAPVSVLAHAVRTCELLREEFPDHAWLHASALLSGLGQLASHDAQPRWAVFGESFPVGCRCVGSQEAHQLNTRAETSTHTAAA